MFRIAFPLLLVCAVVFSCQKEFVIEESTTPTPTPTPNIPSTDSTLLSIYASLDTTLPATQDTLEAFYYTYDDRKRAIKILHISKGVDGFTFYGELFYSGNDSLPFKYSSYGINNSGIRLSTTGFIYYDGTGRLIKDSSNSTTADANNVVYFRNIYVEKYRYLNGFVEENRTEIDLANPNQIIQNIDSFYTTYLNGNLVAQKDTSWANGSTTDSYNAINITYDDKKNPFSSTSLIPRLYLEGQLYEYAQKNNPLIVDNITTFSSQQQPLKYYLKFVYSYHPNNYPKSAITFSRDDNGVEEYISKEVFYYTR